MTSIQMFPIAESTLGTIPTKLVPLIIAGWPHVFGLTGGMSCDIHPNLICAADAPGPITVPLMVTLPCTTGFGTLGLICNKPIALDDEDEDGSGDEAEDEDDVVLTVGLGTVVDVDGVLGEIAS